ncbi:MAG: DUF1109 domain-containing protein [Ramlibacter sp.]
MKTPDLVRLLAADSMPVARGAVQRRLGLALGAGLPLAAALLLLGYGLRPDIGQAAAAPMFWVKLLFAVLVCAAGFVVLLRLARPGVRVGARWLALAAPLLLVWTLAALALVSAPAEQRPGMLMGQSWQTCSASISFISLPVFIAVLMALRTMAPTRPAWAGAWAGVMASGAGAAVYALHCEELAAPFMAVWYVLGMAAPVAAGALLGPRLLRW